jgi:hypothetical protein
LQQDHFEASHCKLDAVHHLPVNIFEAQSSEVLFRSYGSQLAYTA